MKQLLVIIFSTVQSKLDFIKNKNWSVYPPTSFNAHQSLKWAHLHSFIYRQPSRPKKARVLAELETLPGGTQVSSSRPPDLGSAPRSPGRRWPAATVETASRAVVSLLRPPARRAARHRRPAVLSDRPHGPTPPHAPPAAAPPSNRAHGRAPPALTGSPAPLPFAGPGRDGGRAVERRRGRAAAAGVGEGAGVHLGSADAAAAAA